MPKSPRPAEAGTAPELTPDLAASDALALKLADDMVLHHRGSGAADEAGTDATNAGTPENLWEDVREAHYEMSTAVQDALSTLRIGSRRAAEAHLCAAINLATALHHSACPDKGTYAAQIARLWRHLWAATDVLVIDPELRGIALEVRGPWATETEDAQ